MSDTIYTESDKNQPNPLIPVSFVRDIHDNGSEGWTLDINHEIPWIEFGQWLVSCFQQKFNTKADAPLFSPTVYNGTRCAANGTTSRMLVLDSDGGLSPETMLAWLRDNRIESIVYNSARHKSEAVDYLDKFRVVILLSETVDTQTQGKASRALARLLSEQFGLPIGKAAGQWDLDPSRLNGHTLFYVPGQYAEAGETIFEHIVGDPLDPYALIELYPEPQKPSAERPEPSFKEYDIDDEDPDRIEQRAEAAIKVIPNNFADRGTWIKLGMALKSAFVSNDGHGFSLWDSFSREWSGNTHAVIEREWKSFNPHQVKVNTLFWYADQADPSWRNEFRQPEPWKNIKGVMSLQDMIDDWKADPPAENDNEKSETVTKAGRKRFYSSAECAALPPPNWLVKDLIPDNADTAIYGPSGTLKSFVALDLGLSIATALQALGGLQIRSAMPVIYFAGEGFNNMAKKRQIAWQIERGLPPYGVENFWFGDGTPLVNDDASIEADIDAMKEILNGQRLGLFVVDTLSRALNGEDEDKAHSASTYFAKLKRIRDEVGGTSLTVGHFGKDLDRGERGSSNFRASYDTVIWIEKHSKAEDTGIHTIQLFVTKQKDADDGKRIWLQSKRVPLPQSDYDDPEPCSLVLVPLGEQEARTLLASEGEKKKKAHRDSFEQEVEQALLILLPGGGHISTSKLAKYLADKNAGPNMTQAASDTSSESIRGKLRRGRNNTLHKFAFGESDWTLSMESTVQSVGDMIADFKNGQTDFIQ